MNAMYSNVSLRLTKDMPEAKGPASLFDIIKDPFIYYTMQWSLDIILWFHASDRLSSSQNPTVKALLAVQDSREVIGYTRPAFNSQFTTIIRRREFTICMFHYHIRIHFVSFRTCHHARRIDPKGRKRGSVCHSGGLDKIYPEGCSRGTQMRIFLWDKSVSNVQKLVIAWNRLANKERYKWVV